MVKIVLESFDFSGGLGEVLPLIQGEYPEAEMGDSRYLEWEYLQNPIGLPEMVVARSENGEIVGQYVVIPQNYNIGGTTIAGSLSLNTLTRKDFRGQGLFTRMALETYAGCKSRGLSLTLGFPNMQSYPGFVRKLGFHHIGNAVVLVRPLRVASLVKGALHHRKYPKYRSYLQQVTFDFEGEHAVDDVVVSNFEPEDDRSLYEPFWKTRRDLYHQTDRSPQYLKWRYKKIPTRPYTLLKATKDDRLLAFVSLRMRVVYGMKAGFVVDFNCLPDPDSRRAAENLLEYSKAHMKQQGAAFMGALITRGSPEFEILGKAGFFKAPGQVLPHDAPVIVRWNTDSSEPRTLNDISSWFLTFGDYDAF